MSQKGFTLIESVTVIILLGILAVAVAPKFTGSEGYEPYAFRAQLIAALRLTQQRAMQQTDNSTCHQLVIEDKKYGIPDRTDCDVTAFAVNWQPDQTGFIVPDNSDVTFNIEGAGAPAYITFDAMGRPGGECDHPTDGCDIQIVGVETTVEIRIETQGYIHAL